MKIKTSELTGAHLDYWTARAEGIPAEQLTIRRVQRSTDTHCVRLRAAPWQSKALREAVAVRYSTDWAQGGPLIEKHGLDVVREDDGEWFAQKVYDFETDEHPCACGSSPLQAICRAVVRAAFGDEVEEVAVCN